MVKRYREPTFGSSSSQAGWDISPGKSTLSGRLFRNASRDDNGVAHGAEAEVARASGSSGSPLPAEVQGKFESSLGADLSGVRIHTGAESAAAAEAVGARAYAVGNDIHFGAGQYAPSTSEGLFLIAHEVAHTVQQAGASPARQNKLEVSSPADAAEVEADVAATAMVAGAPHAIASGGTGVHRSPPFGITPVTPVAPDPWDSGDFSKLPISGLGDPGGPKIGPLPANTDKGGIPYDVPTTDYRLQTIAKTPPLDEPMPEATIPDAGDIPGWKTVAPGKTVKVGPFESVEPPIVHTVQGEQHSPAIKAAWAEYREQLIPSVQSTWNDDARGKMDSYTQERKGNPVLDQLVAETKKKYDINAIKPDAGTFSDQAGKQQIVPGQPGSTASSIAGQVTKAGDDLKQGAAASLESQDGTQANEVKSAVNALNTHRGLMRGEAEILAGTGTQLKGTQTRLESAQAILATAQKKEDDKDKALQDAKKLADKISPRLGRLVKQVGELAEPLGKLKDAVSHGVKAYTEGSAMEALAGVMSMLEIRKWDALHNDASELSAYDKDNPYFKEVVGTATVLKGIAESARGMVKKLDEMMKQEKPLYEAVAKALEKDGNWKGKNAGDGKTAGAALRAIPVVDRILKVLHEMKSKLPLPPHGGIKADQGFTLATLGHNAKGAADLLKVGGWIAGAPLAIAPEVTRWEGIRAELQVVSDSLGIV